MAAPRKTSPKSSSPSKTVRPPATTPQARENQLIALSYDAAEAQIRSGNATSQLLTHFLKLGTRREELEREKIQHENELLKAKSESMASGKRVEEMYSEALHAMRAYSGQEMNDDDDS